MKKVAIHNLGCKVNSYEAESMEQMLRAAGYSIVPFDENVPATCILSTPVPVRILPTANPARCFTRQRR